MFLPVIFDSMESMLKEIQLNEILVLNTESQYYGLSLTSEEALAVLTERNQYLKNYGRIEIGIDVTKKLIENFCSSPFINQDDYVVTLHDLHEIFYYLKNETEDKVSDDELIVIIAEFYNNSCRGSIELLQGREIDFFARSIRRKNQIHDFFEGEEK